MAVKPNTREKPSNAQRVSWLLIRYLPWAILVLVPIIYASGLFFEAGARAHFSRNYADMRTLETGIEAYFVDFDEYPPSSEDYFLPAALTTPTAYIPRVTNPFHEQGAFYYHTVDNSWILLSPGPDRDLDTDLSRFAHSLAIKQQLIDQAGFTTDEILRYSPGLYAYSGGAEGIVYDSTNGIRSSGDIIRTRNGTFR